MEAPNMWQYVKSIFGKKEGQSLVEYALIIALVAVVLIAGLQALQGGINTAFNNIIAKL
jgi:pilus assembly protein Flp/PilA